MHITICYVSIIDRIQPGNLKILMISECFCISKKKISTKLYFNLLYLKLEIMAFIGRSVMILACLMFINAYISWSFFFES